MEPIATAQDAAQPFASAEDASRPFAPAKDASRPFETARLLLRPLVMADLDDLFALYGQPRLMRYITGRPRSYGETKERLKAHIADRERYGFGLCAAILRGTG